MKPAVLTVVLLYALVVHTGNSLFAQETRIRCGAAIGDQAMKAKDPAYKESRERLEQKMQEQLSSARVSRLLDGSEPLIIQVVVHVIHNNTNNTIGGGFNSNISEEQIRSQIRILNEDFRRKTNTPGFNNNLVGTDMNIEFRLATKDPSGNPTNGITRHYSSESYTYDLDERKKLADIASWPTDCYLNIWVTNLSPGLLGYAQFPDDTNMDGLDDQNGYTSTDGILVGYQYFGEGGAVQSTTYNKGRTTTHEVGHWLGLLHIWGDSYCGNDYVSDTPTAEDSNEGSCSSITSTCAGRSTRNMIENYMDYSPDRCMNIFTVGQKQRVAQALTLSPRRIRLVECSQNIINPPQSETLLVEVRTNSSKQYTFKTIFKDIQDIRIEIVDRLGRRLYLDEKQKQNSGTLYDINLEGYALGVYYVKISTNTETLVRKIAVWP